MSDTAWHEVEVGDLRIDEVTEVIVGGRAVCLARIERGLGALDNRCPHQGGPLGEGTIEDGWVICPWHGYEYDPITGEAPDEGYDDAATPYAIEQRDGGVFVELPTIHEEPTLMDQMVDVLTEWGVDTVFGMVGHSNLGLADAFRKAEADGRLTFFAIRHEGAAAFAASAYGKLTGRPAVCFSIAGPGATNLLTGLWDANVDRSPTIALTGQVNTQVLGPGAFQEIPLSEAFAAVAGWSQTVLTPSNATELMALALKHAIVDRSVAHLIFPDEVQEMKGLVDPPPRPMAGRVANSTIRPPETELARAVELLAGSERPVIIAGNGARQSRSDVIALAEHLDAPLITTFKAKGLVADDHPLATGTLGRSGTRVAAAAMGHADVLLVLGASFAHHTGISEKKRTIQVDFDRGTLGKFHPVEVAVWGDIRSTVTALRETVPATERPERRARLAHRWALWRTEKERRAGLVDADGRMHPARLFGVLDGLVPDDAVLAVDVGNNTYAFGHYFECHGEQDVLMSGYLGSIGFALPAALGAWAAVGDHRKVISISGDGGLGQYLAEFTTAVKYGMQILHIVLNNDELAKISREQVSALRPVWQTGLVNPDFAAYAELCGGRGFRVDDPADLESKLSEALAVTDGPALVEVTTSPRWM
ncbi:MAG: thiamine pyrophosphate-binding protein [Acidimicrobiia bacterium]|nr:MAG: thiamine pyrophosphate-binding protein [Acidimicrobiia bacterium]